jgi:hypothetical protein
MLSPILGCVSRCINGALPERRCKSIVCPSSIYEFWLPAQRLYLRFGLYRIPFLLGFGFGLDRVHYICILSCNFVILSTHTTKCYLVMNQIKLFWYLIIAVWLRNSKSAGRGYYKKHLERSLILLFSDNLADILDFFSLQDMNNMSTLLIKIKIICIVAMQCRKKPLFHYTVSKAHAKEFTFFPD